MVDRDPVIHNCDYNWMKSVRCFAILSTAHGIAHLCITVYAFMLDKCQTTPFRRLFFTYVNYLYDPACGNLTKIFAPTKNQKDIDCGEDNNIRCTVEEATALVLNKIAFGKLSNKAEEVNLILVFYMVFDIIWILSCMTLTYNMYAKNSLKTMVSTYVTFELSTIALLVTDLVCTLIYQKHIGQTQRLDTWLDFLKIERKDLGNLTERLGTLPSTGATWMVHFWCRLYGALMIVNLFAIYIVCVYSYPEMKRYVEESNGGADRTPPYLAAREGRRTNYWAGTSVKLHSFC